MRFTVHRVNNQSGAVVDTCMPSISAARQLVAWCATDNLGMSRAQACMAADTAPIGEQFELGHYSFTIERTS